MKRHNPIAVIMLAALTPLVAQTVPQGWKQRLDRSASASDPDAAGNVKFVTQGSGFHATNPQAATYWNPANTASGIYTLKGTFTLMQPSGHPNFYGLVFGGANLEAEQAYVYFLVAQNGTWLIKKREGAIATNIAQRTPNDAVQKPDGSGKSTNTLEVRVGTGKVDFVVNGTVVHSAAKADLPKTDGIYGIRVNHLLEVQIDGFAVAK